jgi:hypothetical protein
VVRAEDLPNKNPERYLYRNRRTLKSLSDSEKMYTPLTAGAMTGGRKQYNNEERKEEDAKKDNA